MQICFSENLDEDNFLMMEYEIKGGDVYIPSGVYNSNTLYFTGNKRIGFAISIRVLRPYVLERTHQTEEYDGIRYMRLAKSVALEWAAIITYFKQAKSEAGK